MSDEIELTVTPYQFSLIGMAVMRLRDHCNDILTGMSQKTPLPDKEAEKPITEVPSNG